MNIKLRNVVGEDWDYILNLRNDPEFRQCFSEQHEITKYEHYAYLDQQNSNPNFHNWIIYSDNQNVGYIRILDSDISIIIDKKFHNAGIGTQTLQLLEIEAKKIGIKKLIARIIISNEQSKKIFEKNNYKLKMYWFEKEIF